MTVLGVIADTHIPDRMRHLHPDILPIFREAGVEAILHAGDVSVPRILDQLGEVAPVYAVRGNRDWFRLRQLPQSLTLNYEGLPVVLTHGYGSSWGYLAGKLHYLRHGIRPEWFMQRLKDSYPQAKVIVFGHIHLPINDWEGGQLFFNPGTACCPEIKELSPSIGLLYLHAGGEVEGQIINLKRG
jgi:putative phosphoesterase